MKRIAMLCALVSVLASVACGGDSNKPPMTPDSDVGDAGAPTATAPAK